MSHFLCPKVPREGGGQARMGQCPIFLVFFKASLIKRVRAAARKKVQELFDTLNRVRESLTVDPHNQVLQDEYEMIKE